MKRWIYAVALLLICACIPAAACTADIPGGALGLHVLSELSEGGDSAVISPQSLYIALSMAAQGARGDTLNDIVRAMGVDELDDERIRTELDADNAAGVKYANAYFTADDILLEAEYVDILDKAYSARAFALDNDVVSRVNEWANENTDGMIREILKKKPDDSVKLMLANALMLDAKWLYPFDSYRTNEAVFHGAHGEENVYMMCRRGDMLYAQTNGAQVAYLPYEAQGLGMYVILPGEDGAAKLLSDMEMSIANGNVPEELCGLKKKDVLLLMPRISMNYGASLRDTLIAAGLGNAFDMGADFSGITSECDLFIGDIIQRCALEVGEKGTRAAAVTLELMEAGSAYVEEQPVEMNVDRPYIMLITLSGDGGEFDVRSILFAAVVNDIE